jgi:hypothetical protein
MIANPLRMRPRPIGLLATMRRAYAIVSPKAEARVMLVDDLPTGQVGIAKPLHLIGGQDGESAGLRRKLLIALVSMNPAPSTPSLTSKRRW